MNNYSYGMKKAALTKCLKAWLGLGNDDRQRFALDSGERQIGRTLAEIRYDHVARYEFTATHVAETFGESRDLFGLDIFCATGYGTRMLADRIGCRMLGVDASAEAISLANSHFSNSRTFYTTKVFPFELPPRSFDFAVCIESIEHLEEPVVFLRQIVSSLKEKGTLILSTPNRRRWSLEKNPNPFHYRHFTREEVIGLAQGLHLVDWCGQNIYRTEDGIIAEVLPDEDMRLMSQQEGQLQIFVFVKE